MKAHRVTEGRKDRWRMSGGDWVLTQLLLAVVVVVCLVGYLLPTVVAWLSGEPLVLETATSLTAPAPGTAMLPGAAGELTGAVRWTLAGADAGPWILSLVPRVLTAALVITGVVLVWRLGRSIRRGDPFGPGSVRLVRALAVTVLAYAIVMPFVRISTSFAILTSVQQDPALEWRIEPQAIAPFLVGMLLLVLAEAYAQGVRLRSDVEGLV